MERKGNKHSQKNNNTQQFVFDDDYEDEEDGGSVVNGKKFPEEGFQKIRKKKFNDN